MAKLDLDEKILSVICPVFNSEQYLEECLSSITRQTLGFTKNIQIVLIDDGSMDSSPEICQTYLDNYPDNIVYIRNEENKGFSYSRNVGIDHATGEYLSFLDSDDKWDVNAFSAILSFFKKHPEVDCVFTEINNIGAHKGEKYVNDFYDAAKVVDITQVADKLPRNLNNGVFKKSAVGDLRFHERPSGDDELKFITELVLKNGKYGHLKNIKYYYRKRSDNTNIEQTLRSNESYYTDFYQEVVLPLTEVCTEKYGEVIDYVKNILVDCIKRRLRQKAVKQEFEELIPEYYEQLRKTLSFIDDELIIEEKRMPIENKMFALNLKYNNECEVRIECQDGMITLDGSPLYKLRAKHFINVIWMEILEGKIIISGRAGVPFNPGRYSIIIQDQDGKEYPCDNYPAYSNIKTIIGEEALKKEGFRIEIPAKDMVLKAFITFDGEKYETNFSFGLWSKISNKLDSSFYFKNGIAISKGRNGSSIKIKTNQEAKTYENRLLKEMVKNRSIKGALIRAKRNRNLKKKKKPIWLFIDRVNYGNENSLFLFEYVNEKYKDEVDCYYVISDTSTEYQEIKGIGKVLPFGTDEMRDKFVIADAYIISQTSDFLLYPTGVSQRYFRDSIPSVYAYMQHGVLEKDISLTQNKLVTNFNLFVTSAYPEYEYMYKYAYGYAEDEVILTGLARHDLILGYDNQEGNQLIIAPTWRHNISARMDKNLGGRGYNHEFKYSEFYQFYNSLINDERIMEKLREANYRGVLRLHPYMRAQQDDFVINELFEIADGVERYDKQFANCALLVTDYSSIASDYAYAGKPVIYSQFDKDTFYEGHSYDEGFFDYEEDGFGPVCYDYESTVEKICKAIDRRCVMEEKYRERRNKFFAHFDGQNRERLYREIKKQVERYKK